MSRCHCVKGFSGKNLFVKMVINFGFHLSFLLKIRSIYDHSIFIDKLRIIIILFDNYLGVQVCNTRYIYVYGFIPFNQYHSFNSGSNAAQFFTNFCYVFIWCTIINTENVDHTRFFIYLAFPKILQFRKFVVAMMDVFRIEWISIEPHMFRVYFKAQTHFNRTWMKIKYRQFILLNAINTR